MILLGTGYTQDIILIIFFLFFLFLLILKRKLFYKGLARLNKLLIPSMLHKDINRLTSIEKMILAYRYWVTKNSL